VSLHPMLSGWLRVAAFLLNPEDVTQVVVPTMADALHERPLSSKHLRWSWSTHFRLLSVILLALVGNVLCRLGRASWVGYLGLLLAGLSGAVVVERQFPEAHLALCQCVYVAIGVIVGGVIVSAPEKVLRSLGNVALLTAGVGLAVCPWSSDAIEPHQWVRVGSLQLHASTLFLPVYASLVYRFALGRKYLCLAMGALFCTVLLALQPNRQAIAVYLLITLSALLEPHAKWLSWGMGGLLAVSLLVSWLRGSSLSLWSHTGTVALAVALGWCIFRGSARQRVGAPSGHPFTMAMVALTTLRGFDGDTLPVVGFGGSAVAAFFMLAAMQMRLDSGVMTQKNAGCSG
jgi:hypothetical protein